MPSGLTLIAALWFGEYVCGLLSGMLPFSLGLSVVVSPDSPLTLWRYRPMKMMVRQLAMATRMRPTWWEDKQWGGPGR